MSQAQVQRSPREKRKTVFLIATVASMALYTAAFIILTMAGPWPETVAWWLFTAGVAAAIVGIGFTFAWVGALDEVVLQVHKNAWYWGGQIGLALFAAVLLMSLPLLPQALESFITWRLEQRPHQMASDRAAFASAGFMLGVGAAIIPPTLGFLIWTAAFWLRRR